MITADKVSETFCAVNEFCKEFDRHMDRQSLEGVSSTGKDPVRKAVCEQEIHTV